MAATSFQKSTARMLADIRRLLAILMQREIAEPRLLGLCITRLESIHGGRRLHVWVHKPGVDDTSGCVERLNQLSPHFYHELRRAMPRRRLPRLVFVWDESIEAGGDMLRLLRSLGGED